MISVAENLWVGNSLAGEYADVNAVLNVAKDLHIKRGHPTIEYAQVGLTDGPGNPLVTYYAATLTLYMMMESTKKVLVHCHEGKSRSMAIAIMYMHLVSGRGWDGILTLIRERTDVEVPEPHKAHKEAFGKMNWLLLEGLLEGKK